MNVFRLLLIPFLFLSCVSGIRKELNYSSDSIAFYSFENSPRLPSWLDSKAIYIKNDQGKSYKTLIENTLYHLGNKNDSLFNDTALRIFSKELSGEIAERSFQNFERNPNQPYQLWILKKEDSINPGRRIRRSVFLLYSTADSFHFVFLELNQFIDFQTPYSFQDWANYSLSESNIRPSLEVFIPDSAIGTISYFKAENSNESVKYHIFTKFNPVKDSNFTKEETRNSPFKDTEKRLLELKSLYDKKLISEEEYKKKREEILKSL
ncbi:SHOCT domain-containing protein [Leptospira sp. WS92.C1]